MWFLQVPSVLHININTVLSKTLVLLFSKSPIYVFADGELKTLDSPPKPLKPGEWTWPHQHQLCPTWKPTVVWLRCKQNLIHRKVHEKVNRKVHSAPPFKWRLTADMKMAFVFNFIPYGYGVAAGSNYLYLKENILSVDMKHPSTCKT